MIGQRLGPYEIISALGAGGMGEVYRARDTKLNRDVAIKVLLPAVANDPDRLARFSREAQVLASLNHPNIAAIYGIEESSGVTALVMELVEGEDLSQRIARGAIPLDEALPVARQIAEALEAAHDHGIIHRDLKPANIKVRSDGTVKVLDFGLAKAVDPTAGSSATAMNSPTLSIHATQAGIILGTAAYMSPEQARGKSVDKRTDIWALGCVLFEMLTGRRAFPGDDATDTIVAVISKDPDWSALPSSTPAGIRRLLRRCLEKDQKRRLDSAAVFRIELDEALAAPSDSPVPLAPRARVGLRLVVAVVAGIIVGILGISVTGLLNRREPSLPPTRSLISIAPAEALRSHPMEQRISEGRPGFTPFALSPDGRAIVFSGVGTSGQQLFLRNLDQLDAQPIPGTAGGAFPFFSPDGQWLGFFAKRAIQKMALAGGSPPTTIATIDTDQVFGVDWGSRGTIVFGRERGGLWTVPAAGGEPKSLTTLEPGEYTHRLPRFLPDGETVIFTVSTIFLPQPDQTRLSLLTPSGERRDLGQGADARYIPSGHLLFMRSGALMAVAFDPAEGTLTGETTTMIADVGQALSMPNQGIDSYAGMFSASASGALVYLPGGIFPDRQSELMEVNRTGGARVLPAPQRAYFAPLLSPDGSRLVLWTQGVDRNLWTYDLTRAVLTRLTAEGRHHRGVWTPDGSRVTYSGDGGNGFYNLFSIAADGGGAPQRLTNSPSNQTSSSWTPDGKTLLYRDTRGSEETLMTWSAVDGQSRVFMKARPGNTFTYAEVSPDGRWLAYVSSESGRDEVYVRTFPNEGPRLQISTAGGQAPAWSKSGRELYYTVSTADGALTMMVVPLTAAAQLSAGQPQQLFEGRYVSQASTRGYSVSADGQRFYLVREGDRPDVRYTHMVLIENWATELRRRVPVK